MQDEILAQVPPGFNGEVSAALSEYWGAALSGPADPEGARSAVFDWDNTCVWGDVSFACLRQLLREAPALRLRREELSQILPTRIGALTELAGGVPLAVARDEILGAYDEVAAGGDPNSQGAAHRHFRALLLWYYDAAEATPGIGAHFAYPWLIQLFAGHSGSELEGLVGRALGGALAEACGEEVWRAERPGAVARILGDLPGGTMPTSIRPYAPMKALMGAMDAVGIMPHVVTASCEQIVQAAARALGFCVRSQNIAGQKLLPSEGEDAPAGRLGLRCPTQITTPIPHGPGKVEIVRQVLGIEPSFVAGDSIGDLDMFRMGSVRLALLIDRRLDAVHRDLMAAPPRARLVRQGKDDENGCFTADPPPPMRRETAAD